MWPPLARRNVVAPACRVLYPWAMLSRTAAALALVLAAAFLQPACAKPPKQAEVPDALADKGADMSHGEDTGGDIKAAPGEKSGPEKMREKCCGQCKAAAATHSPESRASSRTGSSGRAISTSSSVVQPGQ